MKRLIWASLLLALAAIMMPVLFLRENRSMAAPTPTETSEQKHTVEIPTVTPPVSAPAVGANGQAYAGLSDAETVFMVLDNGAVRETTMAEYLPCAIAAEMPASFEKEALKAQAVAARTYIVYCTLHENPKHPEASVCTQSGCCLAYSDQTKLRAAWGESYDKNMALMVAAVKDTDGQVLTFGDTPILASFHSSSSGKTESGSELWGDVPYLISVESPETELDVPDFVSSVEVSQGDFRETVLLLHPETKFSEDASSWLGKTELDDSGRVRDVTIGGVRCSGAELRKLFALRSTAFSLEYKDGVFLFTVRGYGHGLGMSQYGANVMAKNGFTFSEILLHYYPQTELC
ncbi:MAG: stage II sporulation protein D [Oscillospiraceae bacterium]